MATRRDVLSFTRKQREVVFQRHLLTVPDSFMLWQFSFMSSILLLTWSAFYLPFIGFGSGLTWRVVYMLADIVVDVCVPTVLVSHSFPFTSCSHSPIYSRWWSQWDVHSVSVRWSCHTYDLDMSGHGHSVRRCPNVYAWTFLSATQRLMLAGLRLSSTSYVVCVVGFWTFVVVMMLKVNKTVQNASRMGRGREESPDALNIGANHVARMCPYVYGVISVVDAFITVQLPHTAHPTRRDSDFPHRCFHVLCLHCSSCFGDNHGHFVQGIRKWSTQIPDDLVHDEDMFGWYQGTSRVDFWEETFGHPSSLPTFRSSCSFTVLAWRLPSRWSSYGIVLVTHAVFLPPASDQWLVFFPVCLRVHPRSWPHSLLDLWITWCSFSWAIV